LYIQQKEWKFSEEVRDIMVKYTGKSNNFNLKYIVNGFYNEVLKRINFKIFKDMINDKNKTVVAHVGYTSKLRHETTTDIIVRFFFIITNDNNVKNSYRDFQVY